MLHDHDDDKALAALRAAYAALPPGGTLLIAEPMAQTPGAEAIGDAYFGFYLLAMGSGRPRRHGEMTQLLQAAGFERIRFLQIAASAVCQRADSRAECNIYLTHLNVIID